MNLYQENTLIDAYSGNEASSTPKLECNGPVGVGDGCRLPDGLREGQGRGVLSGRQCPVEGHFSASVLALKPTLFFPDYTN